MGAVRQTIPLLESELASAKQRVEQAAYQIELCAEAVFIEEAEGMATRYVEMLREVRETLYALRFFGARQVMLDPSQRRPTNGAPMYYGNELSRVIAIPQSVLAVCADDCLGQSEYREGLRKRDAVSAAVSALWGALHSDPDAQLAIAELPPKWDADALLAKLKVKA